MAGKMVGLTAVRKAGKLAEEWDVYSAATKAEKKDRKKGKSLDE